jgi:predicted flap endonuclease-1-like 5' DNA nuclease
MVAIIFFVITTLTFVLQLAEFERNLWVLTTVVLGLLFLGLGYMQRPRIAAAPVEVPQPVQLQPITTEPVKEEKTEIVVETQPVQLPQVITLDITLVKGIKTKRAEQLKALGINNANDLANASAKEIGEKLQISPKITQRWIEDAKSLIQKS